MLTDLEVNEYLDQIRKEVCSRCIERPPGGPPCAPLGKDCGVELHLPELIESIHQVHSPLIGPYLHHNRQEICEHCAFLHSSICPCPMDYLAVLIVEAVEAVDQRRAERGQERRREARAEEADVEEIRRAYQEAHGSWSGCDWPMVCGSSGLNLQGWTAAEARAMAQETMDPVMADDWRLAASWLVQVEQRAANAEARARDALHAAEAGHWREALTNAEWAWAQEFSTGRPFRVDKPLAWQRFRQLLEAAYLAQAFADDPATGGGPS